MEVDYGKLLSQNSYSARWSDVDEDSRRYLVDAYRTGGSYALGVALRQLNLGIPLNTARGNMVRAGVKVSQEGNDYSPQLDRNRAPRIYPVSLAQESVKVAFVSDEQVPFNDKDLTKRVQQMVKDYKPDMLVLLGDMLDCYSVSRFLRDPRRRLSFSSELEAGNEYLDSWDSTLDGLSLKVFMKGNHERRLEDYIVREAAQLADLPQLAIENLLRLSERGYNVFEYGQAVDFRGFIATHGHFTGPNAASAHGASYGRSGICGHNHQSGSYSWTDANGPKTWYINGTLMEVSAVNPDYLTGIPNWSQGVTLAQWSGADFTVMPIVLRGTKLVSPWGSTY